MKMTRIAIPALTLLLLGFVISPEARAQTASTGALAGTVSDSSGGVVPGAEVTAVNEASGETKLAESQGNGHYTIPLLPPGTYRVQVKKSGFKISEKPGIRINVAETARLDLEMSVGELTQSVVVEAAPTMAQTESSTLGRVVNEQSVEGLPLVTRNYTQIIGLSPGVETQVTNATDLGRGGGGISPTQTTSGLFVHGARSYDNNFQMDGVSVNDNESTGGSSGGIPIPNADTIEEFKVQTGLYDASFGHNAGANVDVITKGGGNQFHGSAFEFFRNEHLNANNFFFNATGQPRPVLRQNQFGYTLGGPIRKDKLEFFSSYQGTRQLNGASTSINTTCAASVFSPPLTDDRSAGALGALFGGQAGAEGGVAVDPLGGNINAVALQLLQFKLPNGKFLIPTPQVIDPSQPFASQGFSTFSEPCKFSENQFMINADYLQSSRSKISARFFLANSNEDISFPVSTFVGPGNVPGFPDNLKGNFRVFSLAHTYAFSSQLLNEARFGFNRILSSLIPTSPFEFSDVGISEGAQNDPLPSIDVLGSVSMNSGSVLQFAQNTFSFQDSMSWVHGRNSMRFGGGFARLQNNLTRVVVGGTLLFESFPDFLLGQDGVQNGSGISNVFASLDGFGQFDRAYRAWEGNAYYQDDVKVTRRLTINAGLRYERLGLYKDTGGRNSAFDPALADPTPAAPTIQGYIVASNFKGTIPAGVTRAKNSFAVKGDGQNTWGPRLGFSWQILPQTTRFVLRGGFGTYYSRPTGEAFVQNVFGAPYSVTRIDVGSINSAATFAMPFAPPITTFPIFPAYSQTSDITAFGDGQEFRPGIVQQYSLNLQTSLAKDFLLEIGYVGTRGTRLLHQFSGDQALSASSANPIRGVSDNRVDNIAERQPIMGFAPDSLVLMESGGASYYNGLDASLTKRFSHGLQFLASYTFSHTIDTDGAATNTTAAGNAITIGNQNDARERRGRPDYSRPQRLTVSYVYDLPSPKTKSGIVGHVLGGWETAGVLTIQAGQYMTILDSNVSNVFGISEDRASIVPGCSAGKLVTSGSVNSKLNNYFNASCFMTPAVIGADGIGTGFGNAGVGIVRGPDQRNFDLAIIKKTAVGWPVETANFEFRAEMFNTFNTPQFSNPDNNFSSPTFGQISTTSVNSRIIQLALKFNF